MLIQEQLDRGAESEASRRESPTSQPSKETGFLSALWFCDRDLVKKSGF